jgi:hypothetical protein
MNEKHKNFSGTPFDENTKHCRGDHWNMTYFVVITIHEYGNM